MSALELPPPKELLVTMTIAISRDGDVFQDTLTHGNTFAEVYRGMRGIQLEVERLFDEQRQCPYHPKAAKPS